MPKIRKIFARPKNKKGWTLAALLKVSEASVLSTLLDVLSKLSTKRPIVEDTLISSLGINYSVLEAVLNKVYRLKPPHDFFDGEIALLDARLGGQLTVRGLADYIELKLAAARAG